MAGNNNNINNRYCDEAENVTNIICVVYNGWDRCERHIRKKWDSTTGMEKKIKKTLRVVLGLNSNVYRCRYHKNAVFSVIN